MLESDFIFIVHPLFHRQGSSTLVVGQIQVLVAFPEVTGIGRNACYPADKLCKRACQAGNGSHILQDTTHSVHTCQCPQADYEINRSAEQAVNQPTEALVLTGDLEIPLPHPAIERLVKECLDGRQLMLKANILARLIGTGISSEKVEKCIYFRIFGKGDLLLRLLPDSNGEA